MRDIKKVAVIGSGVMGAGIAAHIANSGTDVLLLDIVPKDAKTRNQLTEGALEKLKKSKPAALTHPRKLKHITIGNMEDDLAKLKECDWIIEVVIEKLEIKKDVYRKVNTYRKEGAIVSSNTSTIPLHALTEGMPESFKRDFLITHFFNPPRYMRLLELVTGPETRKDTIELIRNFCDVTLGKGVVDCNDTPGFIANRIGVYWMEIAMLEAMRLGLTVEEADSVMGKPIGVPKTGVFGLMDLIGIDLLPLIAKEMFDSLPEKDGFRTIYKEPEIVTKMIKDGYTGRKGKGGFFRLNTEGGKKSKEVIDFKTGNFRPEEKAKLESVEKAKDGLRTLVEHPDKGGQYALSVLAHLLSYTASLIPEIASNVVAVDDAMRLGYNWKYGPFELVDRLGTKDSSGAAWLAEKLKSMNIAVPPILSAVGTGNFYKEEGTKKMYFDGKGYTAIAVPAGSWMLADVKRGKKPIKKNPSAALWDVGDGVVCLEFVSKMNTFDPMLLDMIVEAVELVKKDHRALIIGNDADNFSVGANIGVLLFVANCAAWKTVDGIIKQGQDTFKAMRYAPFPVVGAPSGMALGGGCEVLLHCDAVQAHVEFYSGLVEVGVGLIPGWGGCKEMLVRHVRQRQKEESLVAKVGGMFSFIPPVKALNTMPAVTKSFEYIATAKVGESAEHAKDMLILPEIHGITMNRRRVLADAKALALKLAPNYKPPEPAVIHLPGATARTALHMAIAGFVKSGKATAHDAVVSTALAKVLSGGNAGISKPLTEQDLLDLERDVFVELVKHPDSLARIEHMLETGKPLRN